MLNLIVSRCHKTTQFQCQLDPQKVEQDSLEHKQKPTLGQAKHVRQSDSRGYIYIFTVSFGTCYTSSAGLDPVASSPQRAR